MKKEHEHSLNKLKGPAKKKQLLGRDVYVGIASASDGNGTIRPMTRSRSRQQMKARGISCLHLSKLNLLSRGSLKSLRGKVSSGAVPVENKSSRNAVWSLQSSPPAVPSDKWMNDSSSDFDKAPRLPSKRIDAAPKLPSRCGSVQTPGDGTPSPLPMQSSRDKAPTLPRRAY